MSRMSSERGVDRSLPINENRIKNKKIEPRKVLNPTVSVNESCDPCDC